MVYTSADSVYQVAAHTDPVPAGELYRWCAEVRALLGTRVARVIARPFAGPPGALRRLDDGRRDFPLPLPGGTLLHLLGERAVPVVAVGKVADLFNGYTFDGSARAATDADAVRAVLDALSGLERGLVFTNAGELDSRYGHRNDPAGWGAALRALDDGLGQIARALDAHDCLVVTGDHGNDPTTPSTDHSREYVPALACSGTRWSEGGPPVALGRRGTFADAGATVADLLTGSPRMPAGSSFASAVP